MRELTPDQFAEWQEFYRVEPSGALARDTPLATIFVALVARAGKLLNVDDVLRSWGHQIPKPPFDPGKNAQAIAAGFGG